MTETGTESVRLTLGEAAQRCGLQWWHLDRLARRGLIPHERASRVRLVLTADLSVIRAAAEAAGYVETESGAALAGTS